MITAVRLAGIVVLLVVASREAKHVLEAGRDQRWASRVFWLPILGLAAVAFVIVAGTSWLSWPTPSPGTRTAAILAIPWALLGYVAWRWRHPKSRGA
ncbi:MAG: hypothetical protein GY926_26400 [bacterium]|nr:hypothetical protein [bacterium]